MKMLRKIEEYAPFIAMALVVAIFCALVLRPAYLVFFTDIPSNELRAYHTARDTYIASCVDGGMALTDCAVGWDRSVTLRTIYLEKVERR